MKIRIILACLSMCAALLPLQAQYSVVKETNRSMSFGSRPCFRMEFASATPALVEDNWRSYVKSTFNGKLKTDRKSDELFATDLKSGLVGDDPFGVYSTIEKTATGSILTVWIDMGSYFLNRSDNRSSTEAVSRSLSTFYYDTRRAEINKLVKDQESKLKELENRQKKLQRDNDQLRKDIDLYKAKIAKAEADVVKNEKDQETNILDTEAQRKAIEATKKRLENVENETQD